MFMPCENRGPSLGFHAAEAGQLPVKTNHCVVVNKRELGLERGLMGKVLAMPA